MSKERKQQHSLTQWSGQVAAGHSSGIASTCYAHEQRGNDAGHAEIESRFIEVPRVQRRTPTDIVIATVEIQGITAAIRSGADEVTMEALFRAMKSC